MKNVLYKIFLASLISFFFLPLLWSQAPGLSGKRLTIFASAKYAGTFMPMFVTKLGGNNGFGAEEEFYQKGDVFNYYNILDKPRRSKLKAHINFQFALEANWMLKRNMALGAFTSYYRDGYGFVEPNLFSKNYQSITVGFQLKLFNAKKGEIAPLGNYISLKLYNNAYLFHYKGNPDIFGEDYIINKTKKNTPGMGIALGRQGVCFNKALFNIGVETNLWNLSVFKDQGINTENASLYSSILFGNLFRFYVGIGFAT